MVLFHRFNIVLVVMALALLTLNIVGIYQLPDTHPKALAVGEEHKNGIILQSSEEAMVQLNALKKTNDVEYLRMVTRLFARTIVHYWPNRVQIDEAVQFEPWENWLLFSLSRIEGVLVRSGFMTRPIFSRRERLQWQSALAKGVGYCSQSALALSGYLEEQGFDVKMIGLGGHVVLEARIGERWFLLDPDFNVVLPFDLKFAEANPQAVRKAYLSAGYKEKKSNELADIYGPDNNWSGPRTSYDRIVVLAGQAKWWVPLLLLVASGMALVVKSSRSNGRAG